MGEVTIDEVGVSVSGGDEEDRYLPGVLVSLQKVMQFDAADAG